MIRKSISHWGMIEVEYDYIDEMSFKIYAPKTFIFRILDK